MTGAPRAHRSRPTPGWRMLTGTGTGVSAALGLLVLVTVFIAVVLPRASESLQTAALRQTLSELPASAAAVMAGVDLGDYLTGPTGGSLSQQLTHTRQQLAEFLTGQGIPVRPTTAWSELNSGAIIMTGAGPGSAIGTEPLQLQLEYSDELMRHARLTSGHWPGDDTIRAGVTTFQVALTPASARLFALHVGSQLSPGPGRVLAVTGIITPVDPGSAFWSQFGSAATPVLISTNQTSYWIGGAFVGPQELLAAAMVNFAASQVSWSYPVDLRHATAAQAASVLSTLTAAASQGAAQLTGPGSSGASFTVSSGLTPTLTSFVAGQATVDVIASLLFVSLAVVGLVVLLMGTQLVADRRRDEFATMAARGATGRQLGWLVLRGQALVVLPAAAIAAGLAVAVTPAGGTTQAWWLAGLTTGSALAAPALLVTRRAANRGGVRPARRDRRRLLAGRRLIAELTLTACAVTGLVVLRQQGLATDGHVDVLTSAAPVLVAAPVAIVVIRLCPPVLRAFRRLASAGRGLIAFLGLARAAEMARRALLPVFALVLALAVVAFGGAVVRSIGQGESAAAWQLTGADAAVGSPASTTALLSSAQRAVAAAPGVRAIAPVIEEQAQTGQYGTSGLSLSVAVVSPRQYAAVLADTPNPAFPAGTLASTGSGAGPLPVLASPAAAAALRGSAGVLTIGTRTVRVRIVGQLASTAAAPADTPFVVLPRWAAGPSLPPPTLLLLAGRGISQRQLSAIVARSAPGAAVTVRSTEFAALRAAPLPRATVQIYTAGAAAAALLCVLIVLISLILDARSRQLSDARLVSMGLSGSQAHQASALELSPFVLAAAVGGTIATAVLAALLDPVLDLSGLTASTQPAQLQSGILTPLLTIAGLVVLAAMTMLGQAAAARRRAVSEALRVSQ
ncbi:MAG: FtsX-like permease family protein [Streptosporangiaceae bacterium]